MAKTSKKLKAAYEAVDRNKAYPLAEAVALVKGNASSKFDETIEIAMNLGVDPRHADQIVRGVVAMPNGTGKAMRVLCLQKMPRRMKPKAPVLIWLVLTIWPKPFKTVNRHLTRVIATPDMMGVVGRLGKVLGPRGLMPNPKLVL